MFRRTLKRELALKRYRIPRIMVNLSQVDTADKAKIAALRYWRIENGYSIATHAENRRLAKLFKVPVEQLMAVAL